MINEVRVVPSASLRPNPWNPNQQSEFMFERARLSIREFGFVDPVTVRRVPGVDGFEVVDGEHRWRAAKLEGLADIAIVDLGEIPDHVAKRLTIALNEISGEPDTNKLAELIAGLHMELGDEGMAALPYTADDIKRMLDIASFDLDSIIPQGGADDAGVIGSSAAETFKVKLTADQRAALDRAMVAAQQHAATDDPAVALAHLCTVYVAEHPPTAPTAPQGRRKGKKSKEAQDGNGTQRDSISEGASAEPGSESSQDS